MTTLIKQTRVLALGIASSLGGADFVAENEQGQLDHVLTMRYEDWLDMGHPSTVTVTVEPGDLLNLEVCANYTEPFTCLTAPSTKTGRCDHCKEKARV